MPGPVAATAPRPYLGTMKSRPVSAVGRSQRQLRAGELVRHALSEMFQREQVHAEDLPDAPLTFTEVKVSPDLKAATVYCSVLGRDDFEAEIEKLNKAAPAIRQILARKVTLKFTPSLMFRADDSFAEAAKIASLLKETRQGD